MSQSIWTPELDAAIRIDWDAGLPLSEIARKHGCTRSQVNGRQWRLNFPDRPSPIGRDGQAWRAIQMDFDDVHRRRWGGATWEQIAGPVKWSSTTLRKWYADQCAERGVTPVVVDGKFKSRPKALKPARVKAVRVAPQKPAQALPALALVRGAPGVAQPPVSFPWPRVREIAAGEAWNLKGFDDLPAYNRSRITRGYAPLAIRRAA